MVVFSVNVVLLVVVIIHSYMLQIKVNPFLFTLRIYYDGDVVL